MRSEKAFGGTPAYSISIKCPCKGCEIRGYGCARICDVYKKYKFVLTVLNMKLQAQVRTASASRQMRDDRIAEWRHKGCWPKG